MIAINGTALADAQPAYFQGKKIIRIYVNGTRVYTDGKAVPPDLKYDVNGDGKVNVSDVTLVTQNVGKPASTNNTTKKCDLNGSGTVDAADVAMIQAYLSLYSKL